MKRFILLAVVVACIGCRAKEKTIDDVYGAENVKVLKAQAAKFKAQIERRKAENNAR